MDWSNTLVASVLTGLQNLNKPFKYAVTCMIMQKTGAGMSTAASCLWDPTLDGYCTVLWRTAPSTASSRSTAPPSRRPPANSTIKKNAVH
ncbi:hypothetical protein PINS_up004357 [Pythium insidiosum]|nr:hypothetical protein PINS_up004357 [Pythium insidiosum]